MGPGMVWQIWIDTGGTFTDALGLSPEGRMRRVKVLSSSALRFKVQALPSADQLDLVGAEHFPDGFFNNFLVQRPGALTDPVKVSEHAGHRLRLSTPIHESSLAVHSLVELASPEDAPVLAARLLTGIPAPARLPPMALHLATTRATNALLTDSVAPTALFITAGFEDLLKIDNQQRPDLFARAQSVPDPLAERIIGVSERLAADGTVLIPFQEADLLQRIREARAAGIKTAAVALMHSHRQPVHEKVLADLLKREGFEQISLSSDLAPFIRLLPRTQTAVVNASVAPVLKTYLDGVAAVLDDSDIRIMTSAGGLAASRAFHPKDSLLSGPAGGVIGARAVASAAGFDQTLAFDMGGTSTDVSRPADPMDYAFEHQVGRARLMAPCLRIETVAAGGGSICWFDGQALRVGPDSAGARPGPACYDGGGPLTLTDVNLLLGRMNPDQFNVPVNPQAARERLHQLRNQVASELENQPSEEDLLTGWLQIADERMAAAIGRISVREGHDPAAHHLVAFGGAGGQHACAVARNLGITRVLHPHDAGLLSARGLRHATMEHFAEREINLPLSETLDRFADWIAKLQEDAVGTLQGQTSAEVRPRTHFAQLRLCGQDHALTIAFTPGEDLNRLFEKAYRDQFGYFPNEKQIELSSLRVVASTDPAPCEPEEFEARREAHPQGPARPSYFDGEWEETPCFNRSDLDAGDILEGPALVQDPYSTVVVEAGWKAVFGNRGSLLLQAQATDSPTTSSHTAAAELELFTNRFRGVVDQMGAQLERTAISTNVKERRDFSCALLDPAGRLVVNAPHIPVHLGALGMCVRAAAKTLDLKAGDVAITNHPAFGGSHLPDITVISPVHDSGGRLLGYVANRAHHAEIGGILPGSMPPEAASLAEEGTVIPPTFLIAGGEDRFDALAKLLQSGPWPTRCLADNMADLRAQTASNHQGARLLRQLADTYGADTIRDFMDRLYHRSSAHLRKVIEREQGQTRTASQKLDDGTPLRVAITGRDGRLIFDFEGTAPTHAGNLNATPAIVSSVVMYLLRLLIDEPLPLNEGLLDAVDIRLPTGLLNPEFPDDPRHCPAVVGGNVETSQRLTDLLILALDLMACGQGTMNNLVFGHETAGYYETLGGGGGAGEGFHGLSGRQVHMTNTAITDPEVLEARYPVRLWRFALRPGSGGHGRWRGGDGVIRELEFLAPLTVSWLTQHRVEAPYGRHGGGPGATGEQTRFRASGGHQLLPPSGTFQAGAGDRIEIRTPGGGGWRL